MDRATKAMLVFSGVCAIGTPISVGIGIHAAHISERQLRIMEEQRPQQGSPVQEHPVIPLAIDYTPFYLASALAILSICSLIGTIIYVRYSRRRQIEAYEIAHSKLKLHSASWGNVLSRKSVLDVISALPREGLTFLASNDILKCDPAEQDDNKYIEVEYSFGDGTREKLVRYQGKRVVLPEDAWLRSEKERIEKSETALEKSQRIQIDALNKQITPGPVATSLRLQFGQPGTMATMIEQQNIWRWFTLQHVILHQEKKGQAPKQIRMWTIYLNFDAPVILKQLQIFANGALPMHEVKECNPRFAIITFAGDIVGLEVTISAAL